MTGRQWPYPGDSPLVRARRLVHAYRSIAEEADPEGCAEMDARAYAWGESWAVPTLLAVDPDEWLSPAEAANIACVGVETLRQMRRRGVLAGERDGRTYKYRAGDIYSLSTAIRGRNRAVTDTLNTDGTSVPAGHA